MFVGLGLTLKDITLAALEELRRVSKVYIDCYTNIVPDFNLKKIVSLIGDEKKVEVVSRAFLEGEGFKKIIEEAKKTDVAVVVPGDPFIATTHQILRIEAAKQGVNVRVVHGISIVSSAPSAAGLHFYKFGKSVTIVFPEEEYGYFPLTPYYTLYENLQRGLHTLFFLDIKVERGRHMRVRDAIQLLMKMEQRCKLGIIDERTLGIGLARIGHKEQKVKAGTFSELLEEDFGDPPHTLIIPGELHPVEEEALVFLCGTSLKAVREWSSKVREIRSRSISTEWKESSKK